MPVFSSQTYKAMIIYYVRGLDYLVEATKNLSKKTKKGYSSENWGGPTQFPALRPRRGGPTIIFRFPRKNTPAPSSHSK